MRQGLLTFALVGALCLGLTSCGMRNAQPDTNGGASTGGTTNNSAADGGSDAAGNNPVTGNGSAANDTGTGGSGNAGTNNGDVGDINNDAVGNADPNTNDNSNTQTRRASDLHRSAYDYLNDGRYRTSNTGTVIPRQGSMGIDMTQSVRDLIDDAKQLSREMMRTGGNITQKAGNAVRDVVD